MLSDFKNFSPRSPASRSCGQPFWTRHNTACKSKPSTAHLPAPVGRIHQKVEQVVVAPPSWLACPPSPQLPSSRALATSLADIGSCLPLHSWRAVVGSRCLRGRRARAQSLGMQRTHQDSRRLGPLKVLWLCWLRNPWLVQKGEPWQILWGKPECLGRRGARDQRRYSQEQQDCS